LKRVAAFLLALVAACGDSGHSSEPDATVLEPSGDPVQDVLSPSPDYVRAADTTAPIIYAAHVSDISKNAATISWSTDEPSSGTLEYSSSPTFDSFESVSSSAVDYDHTVSISGLRNGTTYYYRVRANDAENNEAVTTPELAEYFSFTARDTRNIVVSTAGSDSKANGSESAPYRTLRAAVADAKAGDTIQLRADGLYDNETVTIRVPNITITTHPDDVAAGRKAHIRTGIQDTGEAYVVRYYVEAHGGWMHDLEISGGSFYAIKTESTWNWGIEERLGASNLLIEDSLLHDTGRDAIKLTPASDHVTIRNNEIYNTGVRDSSNADGIDNVNADHMVVVDNHFHDIATSGLYAKGGASHVLIERNLIERTGILGIGVGFYTGAEWFDRTSNPEYQENIDGIARNNIIIDTKYGGIGMYGALRPKVYNNTIINAAKSGHAGITLFPGTIYPGLSSAWPFTIDAQVHNNVVVMGNKRPAVQITTVDGHYAISGTLDIDYNHYHQSTGAKVKFSDSNKLGRRGGDLAKWQAATGLDANSTVGDPMLSDDYTPLTGSLLIGAGLDGVDIGAAGIGAEKSLNRLLNQSQSQTPKQTQSQNQNQN
jgi:hypothetical protein